MPLEVDLDGGKVVDTWYVNGTEAQEGGTGFAILGVTGMTGVVVTFRAAPIFGQ